MELPGAFLSSKGINVNPDSRIFVISSLVHSKAQGIFVLIPKEKSGKALVLIHGFQGSVLPFFLKVCKAKPLHIRQLHQNSSCQRAFWHLVPIHCVYRQTWCQIVFNFIFRAKPVHFFKKRKQHLLFFVQCTCFPFLRQSPLTVL